MTVRQPVLGERMRSFGLVLHGAMDEARWSEFLHAVASAIGMTAVGKPAVWRYPLEGKGGVGHTMVLPITESFLVLDTWSDHDGAYLFVCSCRAFATEAVANVARTFALDPAEGGDGRFLRELRLK